MKKIGLVPAAGYARRLGLSHGSKEMLTVRGEFGAEPVCNGLFRQFETAGIKNAVVVTRPDKKDLIYHITKKLEFDINIKIVLVSKTNSTLESICSAYTDIVGREVYLGFPDMIVAPGDAMKQLSQSMQKSAADIVLGVFPASESEKFDMVAFDGDKKLHDIQIKERQCNYESAWIIASWKAVFSDFLYDSYCARDQEKSGRELYLGDVFQLSLKLGNLVEICSIDAGYFLDIGTREDLDRVIT